MSRKMLWVFGMALVVTLVVGLAISRADTPAAPAAPAAPAGNAAAPAAPAAPAAGGHHRFGGMLRERLGAWQGLKGQLNLTDDQKAQIKKIFQGHKDEIAAARTAVRNAHQALHAAVTAQPTDENAIRSAATNLGKAIGDGAVLRAKIRGEVRGVLTDDQKAKLDKFRADRKAAFGAARANKGGQK